MIDSIHDCTTLNNGLKMPWLGFGVFQIEDGTAVEKAVKHALDAGYRSFDTAMVYRNETGVGKAIRDYDIDREDLFITTKVWNTDQRSGRVQEAFDESLDRLQMEYVDLYLVHWPVEGCYQKTWLEMQKIYESGRAKSIGVSNFMVHHLKDLLKDDQVVPAVNQIEFHPLLVQPDLLKFCRDQGIQLESWSPLIQGQIMDISLLRELADKYGKTPAQIVLRWNIQHKVVTIPKSQHRERIIENSRIFDFELAKSDMELLDGLDEAKRVGPDPYNFNF